MTEDRPMSTDLHKGVVPEELRVARDRLSLTLTGPGARVARIASSTLRAACRCAGCRSLAIQGRPVPPDNGIGIERIVPLGGNAANIAFTDGHDRGVFPWDYLWTLADPIADISPRSAEA